MSTTSDLLNFPVEQLSLDKLGTQLWDGWEHASLRFDISLLAERGGERSEIRSIILQPAFGASVPCRHGSSSQSSKLYGVLEASENSLYAFLSRFDAI